MHVRKQPVCRHIANTSGQSLATYATSYAAGLHLGLEMKTILASTAFVLASTLGAAASTVTFDDIATGTTYTELDLDGVTIAREGTTLETMTTPDGSLGLRGSKFKSANPFVATFDDMVSYVSLDLGDFGKDYDLMYLSAYSATGDLISKMTKVLKSGVAAMTMLTVSGTDIAYVEFGTERASAHQKFKPNSVLVDNLYFGHDPAGMPDVDRVSSVPLPAGAVLILSGLGGLVVVRRKRG